MFEYIKFKQLIEKMRSNLETTYQKTNKKIDVANIKKNNQIQFFTASEQLLL